MNKIKIFMLTLGFSFFLFSPLQAQQKEVYDLLILHSGDVVKGTILEIREGDYIVIELMETGRPAKYMLEAIDKIKQVEEEMTPEEKEALEAQYQKEHLKPIYQFKEKGRFSSVSFGFSFGNQKRRISRFDLFPGEVEEQVAVGFNLQAIVGYQYSRMFGLGVGASYDAYSLEYGESVFTLMGHMRGYLTKGIVAPYWALSTGYGFALKSKNQGVTEAKGGLMLHPELGMRLGASNKTNFTISVGYRFQKAVYTQEVPSTRNIEYRKLSYRRFLFSVGLLF